MLHRGAALVERLKRDDTIDLRLYEDVLKRVLFNTEQTEPDFETQMAAMTPVPERDRAIRDAIATLYGVTHPTMLTYELLAHLVKHRYVDAIINFNWDELLDQSLQDELGAREFVSVVSDRDCDANAGLVVDPSAAGYLPIYLKPHGTARDPDTLRFTREAYWWVSHQMRSMMSDLVGSQRCIVLSLGFGMTSAGFNKLLGTPAELCIYNLSATNLTTSAVEQLERARDGKRAARIVELSPRPDRLPGESDKRRATELCAYTLAHVIGSHIRQNYGGSAHFRSINRHHLVSRLFEWNGPLEGKPYADYLRDRTLVELAFSMIRGRGLVSVTSLVEDRCGAYYERYLNALARVGQPAEEWATLCSYVGLATEGHGNETFVPMPEILGDRQERGSHKFLETLYLLDTDKIISRLESFLSPQTRSRFRSDVQTVPFDGIDRGELLRQTLVGLGADTEIEIHTTNDRICSRVFRQPRRIVTFTALHDLTRSILTRGLGGPNRMRLAVVAETGQWLLDYAELFHQAQTDWQIDLIVAFESIKAKLEDTFADRIQIFSIPWFRHNRHMTVVCSGDDPREGIYFARRLRSAFVTPVYVRDGDARILLQSFIVYAVEAALSPGEWANVPLPKGYRDLDAFRDTRRAG